MKFLFTFCLYLCRFFSFCMSLKAMAENHKKEKIDLPENVAQSVAINAEKSTVMAPLSLYAITCVSIINPIPKRLNVPDAMSVILK